MPWGILSYPSFAGGWKLTHIILADFFGTFWFPEHLSGTLVVSLTSDTNDSTYNQNSWSEEMLVIAQNTICNSVCYMGDLQKFKTWKNMKKKIKLVFHKLF